MEMRINKTVIRIVQGDITEMRTDAIVNAANSMLKHGGGVAGAIVRKGGTIIQEESDTWVLARGEVEVGSSAITSGGNLAARYVIHTVGPRMGEGYEDAKLKRATLSALKMADKHNLKSIAFPAISTGIFRYPVDRCAEIMLSTTREYVEDNTGIELVIFCLYGKEPFEIFKKSFKEIVKRG